MTDIRSKIDAIYSLEQLSSRNSPIHRLHPLCKLLGTLVFIVTVISFDRYTLGRLTPFIFYPVILMAVSDTPYSMLLKRLLIAIPFCLFVGISNLILERNTAFYLSDIAVSYGALGLVVILLRTCLCVMAVLILVGVTPFSELTAQLRILRVPNIFVVMFEMTYRYIGVLFGEAASMRTAYALRAPNSKGIDIRHAGSFVGCLLLRSFDRAERIYSAMKCRGYTLASSPLNNRKMRSYDIVYLISVCALCAFFRVFDVYELFIPIIERMF